MKAILYFSHFQLINNITFLRLLLGLQLLLSRVNMVELSVFFVGLSLTFFFAHFS